MAAGFHGPFPCALGLMGRAPTVDAKDPWSIMEANWFTPGAVESEAFIPGAVQSAAFMPGAEEATTLNG